MEFIPFAVFLKHEYAGGYRFLDRCGEFLFRAEEEMGMIPTGEQAPTGGQMEKPEIGMKLEFDTDMLRLSQNFPGNEHPEIFINHAIYCTNLYQELFQPRAVDRTGAAVQCYCEFKDISQAETASFKGDPSLIERFATDLGMVALSKSAEYRFLSGSKELCVKIKPALFNSTKSPRQVLQRNAPKRQQEILARKNQGADRARKLEQILFLELDLMETAPAPGSFVDLIIELFEKSKSVGHTFSKS